MHTSSINTLFNIEYQINGIHSAQITLVHTIFPLHKSDVLAGSCGVFPEFSMNSALKDEFFFVESDQSREESLSS